MFAPLPKSFRSALFKSLRDYISWVSVAMLQMDKMVEAALPED